MNLNLYLEKLDILIEQRIATKMQFNEGAILNELDIIWNDLNTVELDALASYETTWWFQEFGTDKSELDIHPFAKYFVDQKPKLLKNPNTLKSTSTFFGTPWKTGDARFFLAVEKPFNEMVDIQLVSMSNKDYAKLEEKYIFQKYIVNKFPLFSLA